MICGSRTNRELTGVHGIIPERYDYRLPQAYRGLNAQNWNVARDYGNDVAYGMQ